MHCVALACAIGCIVLPVPNLRDAPLPAHCYRVQVLRCTEAGEREPRRCPAQVVLPPPCPLGTAPPHASTSTSALGGVYPALAPHGSRVSAVRLSLTSPKRGTPWAPKALFGSGRQAQSPKPRQVSLRNPLAGSAPVQDAPTAKGAFSTDCIRWRFGPPGTLPQVRDDAVRHPKCTDNSFCAPPPPPTPILPIIGTGVSPFAPSPSPAPVQAHALCCAPVCCSAAVPLHFKP